MWIHLFFNHHGLDYLFYKDFNKNISHVMDRMSLENFALALFFNNQFSGILVENVMNI